MADEKNTPVIIGVAQYTQLKETIKPLDPLNLIVKACQEAIEDTEVENIKSLIDTQYIVNVHSWSYRDITNELSSMLKIDPLEKVYWSIGGHMPQKILFQVAKAITTGKSKIALITGGEALNSRSRIEKGNLTVDWPIRRRPKRTKIEGPIQPVDSSTFEHKYDLLMPYKIYSLIETALRAASGRSIKEHVEYIGDVLAYYSKIATKNPHAWNKELYSAKDITTNTPDNRYLCLPYTKRMISNKYVDMSAALIITSEKIAKELNIKPKKWVYPMGGANLQNIKYLSQRPKIHDSPAIREASRLALEQAGINLENIDIFDIYSCFPCMIEIARKEIGIPEDDKRKLTITGGLPYFGGPLSNYSLHSIVTATQLIRKNTSLKILINAVGGYNTKHSIGIYGKEPPFIPWGERDDEELQQSIYKQALSEPIEEANGKITIEAFTLVYNRSRLPYQGIVFGKLENGRRTLALIVGAPENIIELEDKELVGKTFPVHFDQNTKYNVIAYPK